MQGDPGHRWSRGIGDGDGISAANHPRQAMDTLSSQSNIAGYKAVILAAEKSPKIFPMLMTAAGTLQPAKVFVIGAGVAGLQAIATARRLGAVVTAFDVRPPSRSRCRALAPNFSSCRWTPPAYRSRADMPKELTPEQQQKQRELMAQAVADSDVVITTAAIPGKPAPKLIPAEVVDRMQPGAVIVDLAAETRRELRSHRAGQNRLSETASRSSARSIVPATVPFHASQVYSTNLVNLLKLMIAKDGTLKIDSDR